MRRIARLSAALLLSVAAASASCGGDDAEEPIIPGGGLPDSSTGAEPGPEGGSTFPEDGGAPPAARDGGLDAGGSGDKDAAPALVLEIPQSIVECGGSPCNTLDNVCCESWSKGMGFTGAQVCTTREACEKKYGRSGEQNRAVEHECDDKEDCSGGQVCCFYAYGQPLCELGDILMCVAKMTGPGGSRICADNDKCQICSSQDTCGFIGLGAPIGVLSCSDDGDCADRPGTSCQPEEDNSATTGQGIKARSYIKVCR